MAAGDGPSFPAYLLDHIALKSAEPDYGTRASGAASDALVAARAWSRRTGNPSAVWRLRSQPDGWGARSVTYVALPVGAGVPTLADGTPAQLYMWIAEDGQDHAPDRAPAELRQLAA